MANAFTTTVLLLPALKRRGLLPSTVETLANSDYLELADGELQAMIVPLIMSVREEYFVTTLDTTLISGTASYNIPPRAIGGKLRDVLISDASSGFRQLDRIEPERVGNYGSTSGGPIGYKLEGNYVVMVPSPGSNAGTLRQTYFIRPGRLVESTGAGEITGIAGSVITCSNVPTTFTTSLRFDLQKGTPGFQNLAIDRAISAVTTGAGGTVTLSAAPPSELVIGDFVCLANESVIPQIPVEFHPLLAERVVFKALEALGDPKAVVAKQVADEMSTRALTLATPRSEGSARVIINPYGPGWGRGRRRGY